MAVSQYSTDHRHCCALVRCHIVIVQERRDHELVAEHLKAEHYHTKTELAAVEARGT